VLEAHDDYWGGTPPIKTLRFAVVPEVASRVNGLLSGEYDFITDLPPDQIGTVESNAAFEVVGGPITNHRLMVFDKNNGPDAEEREDPAGDDPRDRPRDHRRDALGRPHDGAGRPAVVLLRRHVPLGLDRAGI
jgi:ABC-type transport system substrate-binding protein